MREKYCLKVDELDGLAEEILENFKNGVVVLRGDLAAGKTTLVKNIMPEYAYAI